MTDDERVTLFAAINKLLNQNQAYHALFTALVSILYLDHEAKFLEVLAQADNDNAEAAAYIRKVLTSVDTEQTRLN